MPKKIAHCGTVLTWNWHERVLIVRHEKGISRIEIIADDIVRVRFSASGTFTPRHSWDVTTEQPFSLHNTVSLRSVNDSIVVSNSLNEIHINRTTSTVQFYRPDGIVFADDICGPAWETVTLQDILIESQPDDHLPPEARIAIHLNKRLHDNEGYYGFGERTGGLNRRYRCMTNWARDILVPGQGRSLDNLYQAQPFFLAAQPGNAWGLFLNSTGYSQFDVGASIENELGILTIGSELDYYIFIGPTPAAVVEQLTRLTGRPALPPFWALGFHQSRWSYNDQTEIEYIADNFRSRDIPLDVIHFDIAYMHDFRDFTWDPQRFPTPKNLIDKLHENGIRAVTIIDPGVKNDIDSDYDVAKQGISASMFIRTSNGQLFSGYCWPGEALFPDFFRAQVRHWWGRQYIKLLEMGVDGIWNDMNEPAIFDRPFGKPDLKLLQIPMNASLGDEQEKAYHVQVHNLYGTLMARAGYEGLQLLRPDKRPWVLTRNAFTGAQRYAVTWMGDNSSWWEHLEMSLPQLANMGLSGMPHAGVDIGGFHGNADAELFGRWMELGTFYPFMRCHTAINTRAQEPWSFGPEVERICKQSIELRYRLLPYIYTLAHLAYRSGAPLFRPLFYDFPDQPDLYTIEDQFMFGPLLLVAPIYRPGISRRLVELPEEPWYDFWTGEIIDSSPLIQSAPLGRIPIFVRGGSILTLGNIRQSTLEPLTELTVTFYPGDNAQWTLIEDDGETNDYLTGYITETLFEMTMNEQEIILKIHPRQGKFNPHPRTLAFQVHSPLQPQSVTKDDEILSDWKWDSDNNAVLFSWEDDGLQHELVIGREVKG